MFIAMALALTSVGSFHECYNGSPLPGTPKVPVFVCPFSVKDAYSSALGILSGSNTRFANQGIDRRFGLPPKSFERSCSDGICWYSIFLRGDGTTHDWWLYVSGHVWGAASEGDHNRPPPRAFTFDEVFYRNDGFDTQCPRIADTNAKMTSDGWARSPFVQLPPDGPIPGIEAVFEKSDHTRIVFDNRSVLTVGKSVGSANSLGPCYNGIHIHSLPK